MKHKALVNECEALGLNVTREPADGYCKFNAVGTGVRVYWSTSTLQDNILGLPRVASGGRDTHARNLREVAFLVRLSR